MALRADAAGDRAYLAGSLPDPDTTGITVCGWFRVRVDLDAFTTYFRLGGFLNSHSQSGGLGVRQTTNTGSITDTYTNTVDQWIYIASVDDGTNVAQYVIPLGGSTVSQTAAISGGPYAEICLLGRTSIDATEWCNGNAAYVRVFADALTQAEVEAEADSTTAVLTAWADWPLVSDLLDDSGNGRNLTAVSGTPAYEDGPAIGTVEGAVAATVPLPTAALAGTVTATGALTSTVPLPTGSIAGTVTATGALAGSVPLPTAALAGDVATTGALTGSTPLPTAALTAAASVSGQLAGSVPSPAAALAGTVTATGALAGAAPLPVAALTDVAPSTLAYPLRSGTPTRSAGHRSGTPSRPARWRTGAPTR